MKKTAKPASASVSNRRPKLWLKIVLTIFTLLMVISLSLNVYFTTKRQHSSDAKGKEKMTPIMPLTNYIREQTSSKYLIHPLLLVDFNQESPDYAQLKWEVTRTIQEWEKDGKIKSASVYFASLNNMKWMGIGCEEQYLPGSLMKVPILIYYLKQEQVHPGVLNTEFVYERPKSNFPLQTYRGDSIIPGRKYKVSELLRYMIAESDNNATYVLSMHIDQDEYRKIFSDLDIPPYDISDMAYAISPKQYSRFFRVLFSATYLNEHLSEYALELLSACNFREGLVKEIPKGTVVAHKFGERAINYDMNFSESAIVYYNSNPYLLTVMTRGSDVKMQTELVSEISREIYRKYGDI